jgi:hypothetical protein
LEVFGFDSSFEAIDATDFEVFSFFDILQFLTCEKRFRWTETTKAATASKVGYMGAFG